MGLGSFSTKKHIPMPESNVAGLPSIDAHVPFEICPKAKYRSGDAVGEERIEEIRRRGVRPEDAKRIERLERTLDLEEEFSELRRVWAASVLRANPEACREVFRSVMSELYGDLYLPYDALSRLHELELIDESLDFARISEKDLFGSYRFELVLYKGRHPQKAICYYPDKHKIKIQDVSMSSWHARLPE